MAKMINVQTKTCIVCKKFSIVEIPEASYLLWQDGESLQRVWPNSTPDEREQLMSGTHPDCWIKLMEDFDAATAAN